MRVIAGFLGSRRLQTLSGDHTRPTTDKVRGAIFSALSMCEGRFLDAYGGSGAMGIEAVSRGMEAVIVESYGPALKTIQQNVKDLKITDHVQLVRGKIESVLPQLGQFDVAFLDPPYRQQQNMRLLEMLDEHIVKDGWVVIEALMADEYASEVAHFVLKKVKKYGQTKVWFYQKEGI